MNKKLIIQVAVIVIAFGAAAVVLYNGFFANNQPAAAPAQIAATAAVATPQTILPNGSTLDFSVIDTSRFVFNQIQNPKLNPAGEVGVPENTVISSLNSATK